MVQQHTHGMQVGVAMLKLKNAIPVVKVCETKFLESNIKEIFLHTTLILISIYQRYVVK